MRRLLYCAAVSAVALLLATCATVHLGTTGVIRNVNEDQFQGGDLTVLTFNMLHGFGNTENDDTLDMRLLLLTEELVRLHPDIVLLQEASITPDNRHGNVVDRLVTELNRQLESTGRSYNWVFFPAHGSQIIGFFEGSAVLSRYKITEASPFRYATQALWPPEARIAVVAKLSVSETAPGLTAVSTHLTNVDTLLAGETLQHHQASELAAALNRWRAPDGVVVVGGDFNAGPNSPAIAAMERVGALDSWIGTDAPGQRRIDYLFTVGNVDVLESRVILDRPVVTDAGDRVRISDHPGVTARFRLR